MDLRTPTLMFGARRLCLRLPAVLLAVIVAASPATAQPSRPADTFQPWHSVMYRSVVSAQLSPDGRQTLFVRSQPRRPLADDAGAPWTELFLVDERGREVPFVTGHVNVVDPTWIDDTHIGFLAKRGDDARRAFYRIRTAGGEAEKAFAHDVDLISFDVSADGRWLAFLAVEEETDERRKIAAAGFNQEIYEEETPFTRVYLADLDSGDGPANRVITRVNVEGSVQAVRFSPDGQRLLVAVTPTPLVDDSYVAQQLRVIDRAGAVLARIQNPGKLAHFDWGPDGRSIALVAGADRHDPAPGRLLVVGAAGGELRDLLPGLQGHVATFDWRDADTLVYVADHGTATRVGAVTTSGVSEGVVLPEGDLVVTGIDVDDSGAVALVANTPRHPDELYVIGATGIPPVRKTSSNPWVEDLRFANQEVIRFNARDGLQLEGILIYPLDYRRGERYPLIVVAHGGPESHFRNGWLTAYSSPGQVAAARGFVVFYPNYRGSTGRGVEFSKISQAAATGPEFDDLVDGVDHLIAEGLVDRDKVGITGGSYGGYASAWAATYYSHRFAAAIPFVGISNAISKVGTTDIPQEMYDVHHRKWLWEDWDYFAKASPVYYAERNRTPTLILHGKDDPRVHPSQSLELYRHLKVLGQAPVRLVLYPGEGHGNRKSAARLDYAVRTLRWMEHYLKGPGGSPPDSTIDYAQYVPWAVDDRD